MKINLWNVDYIHKRNTRKTRDVRAYVDNLRPTKHMDERQVFKFEKMIALALEQVTPDAMLTVIGFNPLGRDRIYSWSYQ